MMYLLFPFFFFLILLRGSMALVRKLVQLPIDACQRAISHTITSGALNPKH